MFKHMIGILQDATKPSGDPGRFSKCVSHRGCLLTQCCVNQIKNSKWYMFNDVVSLHVFKWPNLKGSQ